MVIKIYFSRSFNDLDKSVHASIRAACEDRRIADRFHLELTDSSKTTGEQLALRITKDIKAANLVVCVYSRRHQIHGSAPPEFTAPPYVVSEAAFALAHGKSLALFVEHGISLGELGLLDAVNLQSERFDRDELDKQDFRTRATAFIATRLEEFQQTAKQAQLFKKYEVYHTIYPNGYGLTHFKTLVEVIDPSQAVPVRFGVEPSKHFSPVHRLPSAADLIRAGERADYQIPIRPFVSFASDKEGVRFEKARLPDPPKQRNFLIRFPKSEVVAYQWMWGVPQFLHTKDVFNGFAVNTSRLAIAAVDVTLRLHRSIRRKHLPRLSSVTAGEHIPFNDMAALQLEYDRADLSLERLPEKTPLFDCFSYHIDLARGTDVLLLY